MVLWLKYEPQELVDTSNLGNEEWLSYRRRGIGGSDAAAILGISPWRTARDLYYDKLSVVKADMDENWVALEMGHLLEDLVARIFAKKTGLRIFQRKVMFQHPLYPWMLADLDYLAELPDGSNAILEIKTTNYNAKENWWYNGEEIVPVYYLKTSRDVWHCNYCQESGGMLALYAKVYGISNADAYREICEALQTGDYAPEYQSYQNRQPQEIAQSVRAPRQAIHQTLSMLFSMLSLTPKHRAHLREVRGLTDDQVERFGFKSTPPPYLCKSLTARLLKQGCIVQGVPGFYLAEDGRWTVRFGTRTAGILIPAKSADGLVCGAQIRLDIPIREENAPADKEGTKYLWLSSSSKPMGTSSESPVHFVGDPCSRVVYVTEGLLKADICHALMNRTFAATAGANNVSKLDELFAFLKKNGTEEIIEAQDMDKYRNVHVEKGASKIYLMARKHGLQCRRLTWNPNYKGLDDWQLALRKNAAKEPKTMTFREQYLYGACAFSEIDACVERWHKAQPDGVSLQAYLGLPDEEYHAFLQPGGNARLAELLNAQRKQLGCRIYQLEFTDTEKTKPFAFSGIDALHKAGFQQPPASEYRLVRDETLYCPKDEPDLAVLERVFDHYNGKLPADYPGRCVAPSDVLELYDAEKRRYYYRDMKQFVPVAFSPLLARPIQK